MFADVRHHPGRFGDARYHGVTTQPVLRPRALNTLDLIAPTSFMSSAAVNIGWSQDAAFERSARGDQHWLGRVTTALVARVLTVICGPRIGGDGVVR